MIFYVYFSKGVEQGVGDVRFKSLDKAILDEFNLLWLCLQSGKHL